MANDKKSGVKTLSAMGKVRRFIADTVAEMRRCSWPGRQELFESTILVVVAMAILSVFVFGVDKIAMKLISLVTVG